MGLLRLYRTLVLKRRIAVERKLRERCIVYAGEGNIVLASSIYRFIKNGTYLEVDPFTGERTERTYPNLEGV